jgi:iron(III) transport system substrate-binding protein
VFYAATRVSQTRAILNSFRKHYPFIKTYSYRASGFRLVSKVLTEARAGRYEPDLIEASAHVSYELVKAGLTWRYVSPERKHVRREFMDKDGVWTGLMYIRVALGYNTDLVKDEDVPLTYLDLLDPKWKGKVSIDSQDTDVLSAFIDAWGEDRAFRFFRGLARNQVSVRRSRSLQAQLLAAGEFHIAAFLHGNTPAEMKRKGAPIQIVMLEPYIAKVGAIYLAKNSAHPHAALLLYDYLLSEEIQKLVAEKFGRGAVRAGMVGRYPELERDSYQIVNPDSAGPRLRRMQGFFKETFGITSIQ